MEELEGNIFDMDGQPQVSDSVPFAAPPSKESTATERFASWYDRMVMTDGGIIRFALVLGAFIGIATIVLVVLALAGSPHSITETMAAMGIHVGRSHTQPAHSGIADWTRGDYLTFDVLYSLDSDSGKLRAVPTDDLSLYDPDASTGRDRVYRVRGSLTIDENTGEAWLELETNLPELSSVIISQYELNVHAARFARIGPVALCTDKECTFRDPDHVSGHFLDTMKAYTIHREIEPVRLKEWADVSSTELYILLFTRDKNGDLSALDAGIERHVTTTRCNA